MAPKWYNDYRQGRSDKKLPPVVRKILTELSDKSWHRTISSGPASLEACVSLELVKSRIYERRGQYGEGLAEFKITPYGEKTLEKGRF